MTFQADLPPHDYSTETDPRRAESALAAAILGLAFERERFVPLVNEAAKQAVRLGVRLNQATQSPPTALDVALMIDDPGLRRTALERELDDTTDYLRRIQAAIDQDRGAH